MKLSLVTVAMLPLVVVEAFAPMARRPNSVKTLLHSAVAPPERIAPDAGYVPEWEDRPGLPDEEFLASDMSKPDLSEMWECPLTRWDSEG